MTDPQDSDQELRIDESPESDIVCLGEFDLSENKKIPNKTSDASNNLDKIDEDAKSLKMDVDDSVDSKTNISNNEKILKEETIVKENNETIDISLKTPDEKKLSFETRAVSHSPRPNETSDNSNKRETKKKDSIKDIKSLHKEIILKPLAEGLLVVPQCRYSNDETLKTNSNQTLDRNSRSSSVCSTSSTQRNKRKSNTPKHVNFIPERMTNFEENEFQKQKILDILQASTADKEQLNKGEKRKCEDNGEHPVIEKKPREEKDISNNSSNSNNLKKEKASISKTVNSNETTLGKLLVEKEKIDEKPKEISLKSASINVASPKDANFAPIKPKPSPAMIFKPMKVPPSTNLPSQPNSSGVTKSPAKNSTQNINKDNNSSIVSGNKQLNAIAQMSKNISKTNNQSQIKSTQESDSSRSNSITPSVLSTAPHSKKRTQYHKMMNRNQGEPTVREMLSPQIKYSRKSEQMQQQNQSVVSRTNGIITQNASFVNYSPGVYPPQMLVAAGYPGFSSQHIYSNQPYGYIVPAPNSIPTQITSDSIAPPKLAPVIDNSNLENGNSKDDIDEFKEMPDIQHTKTQIKEDITSAKENSKPAKIKKLVDEKDIEEVTRAFEKEAEKCSGLRSGRKKKVLKHSLDGGTMIEEHPEPPKHVLKKTLEKIVPGQILENARNAKDKKKLNVPTPEKRKGTSKEIQRLLEMDFGVGKSPFVETNYDKYSKAILKGDKEEKVEVIIPDNSKKGFCLQCNAPLPSPRTRKSEIKFCNKECERQHNNKSRRSLRDNISLSSDSAKELDTPTVKEPTEVKKGRGGRRSKNVKVENIHIDETPKTSKGTPTITPKESPNSSAPSLVPEVSPDQSSFKSPSTKSINEEDKSPMPVLESIKSPVSSSPQTNLKEAIASSIFTIEGLDVYKVKSWTPSEVMHWVNGLCRNELGQIFKDEEIDGECLLILDKETLKQHLQFKVGPSMKILEEIKKIKELQKLP
uniref:SAM domain-containing protein n=1 Tax=Parastrongyloides trichosuri TaxID=131310 RepID=A0A0N4ZH44_PARTI